MKLKKSKRGNYNGWWRGFRIYARLRPHGGWNTIVWHGRKFLKMEGYFGSSLWSVPKMKAWVKNEIKVELLRLRLKQKDEGWR